MSIKLEFLDKTTALNYQEALTEVRLLLRDLDTEGLNKDQLIKLYMINKRVPSLFNLEMGLTRALHSNETETIS